MTEIVTTLLIVVVIKYISIKLSTVDNNSCNTTNPKDVMDQMKVKATGRPNSRDLGLI